MPDDRYDDEWRCWPDDIRDLAERFGLPPQVVADVIRDRPDPEPVPGMPGAYYVVKHDGPNRAQRRERGRGIRRYRGKRRGHGYGG